MHYSEWQTCILETFYSIGGNVYKDFDQIVQDCEYMMMMINIIKIYIFLIAVVVDDRIVKVKLLLLFTNKSK